MRFAVIQLFDVGRRLTKDEIAAAIPIIGDLEVSDWREGNASRRILRQAKLVERRQEFSLDIIHPLFDPVLLRVAQGWMALRGWQIHSGPGRTTQEVTQEWLVREVTPEIEKAARMNGADTPRRQMPHEGNAQAASAWE